MTSIKFRALSHNDHKLFFEALGEYGKDFQNIQQYMAQKCGKSNNSKSSSTSSSSEQNKSIDQQERKEHEKKEEDKKREQIRNFYNKLYGKLSQLIGKLDDRVEKVNQELYLLINYGEIWKKHGFKFNNKTKKLLEELVYQGSTTLRFKSKNVRLRTPPCKALKKINEIGIDEKVKVVTTRELPKDVIVEFHPATNMDWLRVQSISQNPRVRAKLSIQKRLSTILEFLENKWNISPEKLNRTVDTWLKVPPNNQTLEDFQNNHHQQQYCPPNANSNGNSINCNANQQEMPSFSSINGNLDQQNQTVNNICNNDMHPRLRLKPSAKHELKEVNITRVVPDNHLDLSLSSYISRLGESKKAESCEPTASYNKNKDALGSNPNLSSHNNNNNNISSDGGMILNENFGLSQDALSSSSRLPLSLTTPDSSILLERSSTCDQPSITQARKHLNLLQSLAGSFEGCENSRTALEDTQAALFDEDAAIDINIPTTSAQDQINSQVVASSQLHNSDSQNSKSVDFHIPKNLTLGDWFKMAGGQGGDNANDAFPEKQTTLNVNDIVENIVAESNDVVIETVKEETTECRKTSKIELKPHNHMIEMKKLAKGWIRQDESSMTIGELFLAFKCPERIVLEYEFENFTFNNTNSNSSSSIKESNQQNCTPGGQLTENPSNNTLIFKLLTAASLSLAHIERQKQEQQHKLHDQPGAKLKRRKGPSNPNTIKYLKRDEGLIHDIEATNQRVEEALKQLQPTRLSVFRRAR